MYTISEWDSVLDRWFSYLIEVLVFFFFFSSRRRHTRSDRDWSSDVCSSDRSEEHTSELQSSRRRHTRSDRDWSSDVCSSHRSEEHTSELQSRSELVYRLLLRSEESRVRKE